MRDVTYTAGLVLVTEECCNCGVPFAMTKDLRDRRLDDHKGFYCPNGHVQYFTAESEAERLKRRLANERENTRIARADAEVERNRTRAYKGHATRLKKRVAAGKCPCCSRTFNDLATHVREEHPGYADSEIEAAL